MVVDEIVSTYATGAKRSSETDLIESEDEIQYISDTEGK